MPDIASRTGTSSSGHRLQPRGLRRRGVTLVEFVCCMLILGIVAGGFMPRFVQLGDEAHSAIVDGVFAALVSGHQQVVASWYLAGSPGKGSNTVTDVQIGNVTVRFRNGNPQTTTNSNHIPVGTPDRSTAQARLFFLLLDRVPEPFIGVATVGSGWSILGTNAACAPAADVGANPRHCWEYRVNDARFARITYSVASGNFHRD